MQRCLTLLIAAADETAPQDRRAAKLPGCHAVRNLWCAKRGDRPLRIRTATGPATGIAPAPGAARGGDGGHTFENGPPACRNSVMVVPARLPPASTACNVGTEAVRRDTHQYKVHAVCTIELPGFASVSLCCQAGSLWQACSGLTAVQAASRVHSACPQQAHQCDCHGRVATKGDLCDIDARGRAVSEGELGGPGAAAVHGGAER